MDVHDPAVIADFKTIGLYTKSDLPEVADEKRDSLVSGKAAAGEEQEKEKSERGL